MAQNGKPRPSPRLSGSIPGATYRLQFNAGFAFQQATALCNYLQALNITHCYASPLLQAGAGSTHGYDVCCFNALNPDLGSSTEFETFSENLRQHDLGLLLDFVPNHMRADVSNPWWFDVLENGSGSPYAYFFDVNWQPCTPELRNKVLLPVLGRHLGEVLDRGELRLSFEQGTFSVDYFDKKFPVCLATCHALLLSTIEKLQTKDRRARSQPKARCLARTLETASLAGMRRCAGELHDAAPEFREAICSMLEQLNSEEGRGQLRALLDQQHYRLAFWRVASDEINYRRFFDVTDLVSMRMELPEVFAASHELLFKLLDTGVVSGLRIDHPDGLWNPKEYFERLQQAFASMHPDTVPRERPLYIVAEKILGRAETLPGDWQVAGTTGYDFLNQLNNLFVEPASAAEMDRIYSDFVGVKVDFRQTVYLSKREILESSFSSELNELAHRARTLALSASTRKDFTLGQLRRGIESVLAAFPVYRTYVTGQSARPSKEETSQIRQALADAKAAERALDAELFEFLADLLLFSETSDDEAWRKNRCDFVMKFQQVSAPVMAKGFEDTALYRFHRLISLNEVGGAPLAFGSSVEQFHHCNIERLAHWPDSLLATSTHDTKRGEDVRARINVLSELPDEWEQAVRHWKNINYAKKRLVDGQPAPDANDEYLLYQTLVGTWSGADAGFAARIVEYMLKAVKEAKVHTNWVDPNTRYEEALKKFIEQLLPDHEFLRSFEPFAGEVAFFGRCNSLSQTLLKLTSPGVPDTYQGAELWDLSLVDPDNRRPVEFDIRRKFLSEIKAEEGRLGALAQRLLMASDTGQVKLFTIYRTLSFRKQHRELFERGDYVTLAAEGEKARHVCAFARKLQGQLAIVAAPRLVVGLLGKVARQPISSVWKDTSIVLETAEHRRYRNVFTGETVQGENGRLRCEHLFSRYPLALVTPAD